MTEWRESENKWKPREAVAAGVVTALRDAASDKGTAMILSRNPFAARLLSFAESQIIKSPDPPRSTRPFKQATRKDVGAELSAAIKEGSGVEGFGGRSGAKGRRPQPTPASSAPGADPRSGSQQQSQADVWASRGEWKTVDNSRDVYAIRYDIKTQSLYVQYKASFYGTKDGPGAIYEYGDVSIPEARSAYTTRNIDDWLWNRVRIRGSWTNHQKPYRLVSESKRSGGGREWRAIRQIWKAAHKGAKRRAGTQKKGNKK